MLMTKGKTKNSKTGGHQNLSGGILNSVHGPPIPPERLCDFFFLILLFLPTSTPPKKKHIQTKKTKNKNKTKHML